MIIKSQRHDRTVQNKIKKGLFMRSSDVKCLITVDAVDASEALQWFSDQLSALLTLFSAASSRINFEKLAPSIKSVDQRAPEV